MLPDFTKARLILEQLQKDDLSKAMNHFMGPFWGNVPRRKMHEGNKLRNTYKDNITYDTPVNKEISSVKFDRDEILKDPNIVMKVMINAIKELCEKQSLNFFKSLEGAITSVGNNLQPVAGKFSSQDLLAAYRKIEIPFDAAGNPSLPDIVASSDVRAVIQTVWQEVMTKDDLRQEFENIISDKRKLWNDKQNNRKLAD